MPTGNDISHLINGSEQHQKIISVIRSEVKQHFFTASDIPAGGIAIYKFDECKEKHFCLDVYPLDEKNVKSIPEEFREAILKIINRDRTYDQFYHYDHLIHNYDSDKHFVKTDEEGIEKLVYPSNKNGSEGIKINGSFWKWESISEQYEGLTINTLDQLFFPSGTKKFIFIPLPVLCSPVILVALPYQEEFYTNDKIQHFIKNLRPAVNHYFISRLIDKLTEEKLERLTKEEDFVMEFVKQIAHVLLPLKYKNGNGEWEDWVPWGKTENGKKRAWESSNQVGFSLALKCKSNDGKYETYKIKFKLITFCFKKSYGTSTWLHETKWFASTKTELKERLEDIFKLVYQNWHYLKKFNDSLDLVWSKYVDKVISDANINVKNINNLSRELTAFTEGIKEIKSRKPSEEIQKLLKSKSGFFVNGDNYELKVDGNTIIKKTYPNTSSKQQGGVPLAFDVLHYIIKTCGKNSNSNKIELMELVMNVDRIAIVMKREKYELIQELADNSSRQIALEALQYAPEDIYEVYTDVAKKLQQVLEEKENEYLDLFRKIKESEKWDENCMNEVCKFYKKIKDSLPNKEESDKTRFDTFKRYITSNSDTYKEEIKVFIEYDFFKSFDAGLCAKIVEFNRVTSFISTKISNLANSASKNKLKEETVAIAKIAEYAEPLYMMYKLIHDTDKKMNTAERNSSELLKSIKAKLNEHGVSERSIKNQVIERLDKSLNSKSFLEKISNCQKSKENLTKAGLFEEKNGKLKWVRHDSFKYDQSSLNQSEKIQWLFENSE